MPYSGSQEKVKKQVTNPKFKPKFSHKAWKQCSKDVKDLTLLLLERDPEARLEICHIKGHPWLNDPDLVDQAEQNTAQIKKKSKKPTKFIKRTIL